MVDWLVKLKVAEELLLQLLKNGLLLYIPNPVPPKAVLGSWVVVTVCVEVVVHPNGLVTVSVTVKFCDPFPAVPTKRCEGEKSVEVLFAPELVSPKLHKKLAPPEELFVKYTGPVEH